MITLELKDNENLLLSKNDNFFSKSEKFTNWKFSRTANVKKYSKSDFEMFLSIVNATFNETLTTNQFLIILDIFDFLEIETKEIDDNFYNNFFEHLASIWIKSVSFWNIIVEKDSVIRFAAYRTYLKKLLKKSCELVPSISYSNLNSEGLYIQLNERKSPNTLHLHNYNDTDTFMKLTDFNHDNMIILFWYCRILNLNSLTLVGEKIDVLIFDSFNLKDNCHISYIITELTHNFKSIDKLIINNMPIKSEEIKYISTLENLLELTLINKESSKLDLSILINLRKLTKLHLGGFILDDTELILISCLFNLQCLNLNLCCICSDFINISSNVFNRLSIRGCYIQNKVFKSLNNLLDINTLIYKNNHIFGVNFQDVVPFSEDHLQILLQFPKLKSLALCKMNLNNLHTKQIYEKQSLRCLILECCNLKVEDIQIFLRPSNLNFLKLKSNPKIDDTAIANLRLNKNNNIRISS